MVILQIKRYNETREWYLDALQQSHMDALQFTESPDMVKNEREN